MHHIIDIHAYYLVFHTNFCTEILDKLVTPRTQFDDCGWLVATSKEHIINLSEGDNVSLPKKHTSYVNSLIVTAKVCNVYAFLDVNVLFSFLKGSKCSCY